MINVDTVYQTVQALVNKEQRGYLTPQEFNLFVNQVQQDIYEQYFYDLNAFREKRPEAHLLGDSVSQLMEKIRNPVGVTYAIQNVGSGTALPAGRVGRIFLGQGGARRTLRLGDPDEIQNLRASRWHVDNTDDILYFDDGDKQIQVWDVGGNQITGSQIDCEVITGVPRLAFWGYTVVNEKPMYNPAASRDIDLDATEQSDVVMKILKLAGISIEAPQVVGVASQEEQMNIQQENK